MYREFFDIEYYALCIAVCEFIYVKDFSLGIAVCEFFYVKFTVHYSLYSCLAIT